MIRGGIGADWDVTSNGGLTTESIGLWGWPADAEGSEQVHATNHSQLVRALEGLESELTWNVIHGPLIT